MVLKERNFGFTLNSSTITRVKKGIFEHFNDVLFVKNEK